MTAAPSLLERARQQFVKSEAAELRDDESISQFAADFAASETRAQDERIQSLEREVERLELRGEAWLDAANNYNNQNIVANERIAGLEKACKELPLEQFEDEPGNIDAAEYVNNAAKFYNAMIFIRAALARKEGT